MKRRCSSKETQGRVHSKEGTDVWESISTNDLLAHCLVDRYSNPIRSRIAVVVRFSCSYLMVDLWQQGKSVFYHSPKTNLVCHLVGTLMLVESEWH